VKLARKIGGNPALAQFELEIMPGAAVEDDKLAGRSKGGDEPHDDLTAERIAKAVYATDGTLGDVPVRGIAAPGGRGRSLAQSPEPGDRHSP
jgi:hypothetical protein